MSRINNMAYDVFFVNQETVVTQDTKLYSQEYVVNNNAYDYVFLVNTGNTNSINELFSTRTYVQNYSDPNRYDIDLTTNQQFTNMMFGVSITGDGNGTITMGSAICATGSFDNQTRRLPHRMLEVMAHKIFGHAQARAAIANDAAFETLIGALSNGLNNSINQMRNDIFNQYITYDRIERIANGLNNVVTYNDDEVPTSFNFDNAEFDCPVRLVGKLSGGGAEMGLLNNGPDVLGNRVINGEYSIPMLVRFRRAITNTPAPTISYPNNTYLITQNEQVNIIPTNLDGLATTWNIIPSLPNGLSFSTTNGSISGVANTIKNMTAYTITATGLGGSVSTIINIVINPITIRYGFNNPEPTPTNLSNGFIVDNVNRSFETTNRFFKIDTTGFNYRAIGISYVNVTNSSKVKVRINNNDFGISQNVDPTIFSPYGNDISAQFYDLQTLSDPNGSILPATNLSTRSGSNGLYLLTIVERLADGNGNPDAYSFVKYQLMACKINNWGLIGEATPTGWGGETAFVPVNTNPYIFTINNVIMSNNKSFKIRTNNAWTWGGNAWIGLNINLDIESGTTVGSLDNNASNTDLSFNGPTGSYNISLDVSDTNNLVLLFIKN